MKTSMNLSKETIDEIDRVMEHLALDNRSTTIRYAIRKLYNEHKEEILKENSRITRAFKRK